MRHSFISPINPHICRSLNFSCLHVDTLHPGSTRIRWEDVKGAHSRLSGRGNYYCPGDVPCTFVPFPPFQPKRKWLSRREKLIAGESRLWVRTLGPSWRDGMCDKAHDDKPLTSHKALFTEGAKPSCVCLLSSLHFPEEVPRKVRRWSLAPRPIGSPTPAPRLPLLTETGGEFPPRSSIMARVCERNNVFLSNRYKIRYKRRKG